MTTDQAARDAGLLPAGAERGKPCWCCGDPIGEHYVLTGQIPQVPGVGLVTCVGCAALMECGR